MKFDAVPQALTELVARDRWVNWRLVGETKVPCDYRGTQTGYNNPANLRDFANVVASVREGLTDGIGYAPCAADGFLMLDIDDCIGDDGLSGVAVDMLSACGSYAEISPSGTGLRIIGRCRVGELPWRKLNYATPDGLLHGEMYRDTGFVTITFDTVSDVDALADITDVAIALQEHRGRGRDRPDDVISDTELAGNPDKLAPLDVIAETLSFIKNTDRSLDWSWWKERIGFAVWAACAGAEEGLVLWENWSRQNPNYTDGDCETAWNQMTASPPDRVGFGSLLFVARAEMGEGWQGGSAWQAWHSARLEDARLGALREAGSLPRVEGMDSSASRALAVRGERVASSGVGGDDGDMDVSWSDDETWKESLQYTEGKNAEPRGNILNAKIAFSAAPDVSGVLTYDEFASKPMVLRQPPWQGKRLWDGQREMTDTDITDATAWLQANGIQISAQNTRLSLMSVCEQNRFHPVREYLSGLTWDGTGRLDSVLIDFLGAEDTPLVRKFTSKTFIAAVARVMQPGCQMRTVLTLEGDQDIGKSKFCYTILPNRKWHTDTCPDIGSKDAAAQLQGVWLQEHAEMASMGVADSNRIKTFISTSVDRFRPSYGYYPINFPRQCIFIASVNRGGGGYLKDETGGTRFWPVACGVTWEGTDRSLDAEALAEARDQLWAEAVVRYQVGETWWLSDVESRRQQAEAVDDRYDTDVWQERIDAFLVANPAPVTTGDVLRGAALRDGTSWTRADQMRVAAALVRGGRKRMRAQSGGTRAWHYVTPGWTGETADAGSGGVRVVVDNTVGAGTGAFAAPKMVG